MRLVVDGRIVHVNGALYYTESYTLDCTQISVIRVTWANQICADIISFKSDWFIDHAG